jgi:hypothetical protein
LAGGFSAGGLAGGLSSWCWAAFLARRGCFAGSCEERVEGCAVLALRTSRDEDRVRTHTGRQATPQNHRTTPNTKTAPTASGQAAPSTKKADCPQPTPWDSTTARRPRQAPRGPSPHQHGYHKGTRNLTETRRTPRDIQPHRAYCGTRHNPTKRETRPPHSHQQDAEPHASASKDRVGCPQRPPHANSASPGDVEPFAQLLARRIESAYTDPT